MPALQLTGFGAPAEGVTLVSQPALVAGRSWFQLERPKWNHGDPDSAWRAALCGPHSGSRPEGRNWPKQQSWMAPAGRFLVLQRD